MMKYQYRKRLAITALESVLAGGTARDFESQIVDFKEEAGSRTKSGEVRKIGPKNEATAEALAQEAACIANTSSGGVLVVGVADKESGRTAFIGAQSDADWLKQRILELTQPNLVVQVEEFRFAETRLLLIDVNDALEVIRVKGKIQTRVGTRSVEMNAGFARDFLEQKHNFDWSFQGSGMHLSQVDAEAMSLAHTYYERSKGKKAGSNRDLAKSLGILRDDTDDPELTRAGALLLCDYDPNVEQINLMITNVEGQASRIRERGSAPILPLFEKIMQLLLTEAFPSRDVLIGYQSRKLRAIPEVALRESIVNAIMHRDYRIPNAKIVVLATGNPSHSLKVISPGGLLPEISMSNLIATPSKPRNANLAKAMLILGLAETEGIGIATMYKQMLREGHPAPNIVEQDGSIAVRLTGGEPELALINLFDTLGQKDPDSREDIRAVLAVTSLLVAPTIRPEELALSSQCMREEALNALKKLEVTGIVERLLDKSLTFRLTDVSRDSLDNLLRYATRSSLEDQQELVLAYLDSNADIAREETMNILKVKDTRATMVLKALVENRVLTYVGKKTGRNVRYKRA